MTFDVIFINQVFFVNKESYYKLFIRPNLKREVAFEYYKHMGNFNPLAIVALEFKLYLNTLNGFMELKNDNNEPVFKFNSFIINHTKFEKLNYIADVQFLELNIPTKYLEGLDQIILSFEISAHSNWFTNLNLSNSGKITINLISSLNNIVLNDFEKNITIYNKVTAFLNNTLSYGHENNYMELVQEDLHFQHNQKQYNLIDQDFYFNSVYKKNYENNLKDLFGEKTFSFLENYLKRINSSDVATVESEIISNKDFNKFYNIKKFDENISTLNNSFSLSLANKTSFKYPENIVEDCKGDWCEKGIVYNPLHKGDLIFNKKITYNGLKFQINYLYKGLNIYKTLTSSSNVNKLFNYNYNYLIDLSIFNKFTNKNKEGAINYINENEEEVC
ncbi:hypothetical protein SLITO_v1c01380 [Spiroplasma litorale]|uniref:Uncharacterized protein n=1 Tax=Spiroplasma litorale TaxID=216942 RepID=A0A0K1W0H7_9MOLU|nr:hypothetical protein [Spiroplasma litorale]AKX33804.1 hypothetical protein SLITO_v1c01380 [Spiroplasma litorale]